MQYERENKKSMNASKMRPSPSSPIGLAVGPIALHHEPFLCGHLAIAMRGGRFALMRVPHLTVILAAVAERQRVREHIVRL